MTTVILSDTVGEYSLCVNTMNDLNDMANNLFPSYYGKFSIIHNSIILDKTKPLKYYNICDNDVIIIRDEHQQYEIEDMDMLSYTHLYILATIDNYDVGVMIDSGASLSVISSKLVSSLGLTNKINSNIKYTMRGVGRAKCSGVIHNLTMKINNIFVTQISLNVIDTEDNIFLFGLDVLNKNRCIIDVNNKNLIWNDLKLNLLNEIDVVKYKIPINNIEHKLLYIEQNYFNILSNLNDFDKIKFAELIHQIIKNILNKSDKKFMTLPKNAKLVNDFIIKNNGTKFIESIGFIDNGDSFKLINTDDDSMKLLENTLKIITSENVAMAC
jgi:hypothetical protein